jgi:hypothetical protein
VSEDSQFIVPPSFIALFVPPRGSKPNASRAHIAARYDLCEDLAQMLTETARARQFELGIDEASVLERIHRGLLAQAAPDADAAVTVNPAEAGWVVRRLAELLDWPPLRTGEPTDGPV